MNRDERLRFWRRVRLVERAYAIVSVLYCSRCGHGNEDKATYCSNCGMYLAGG